MTDKYLNINKSAILDLDKKFPNMHETLLDRRKYRLTENEARIDGYYIATIEKNIINRNNIGLTFLAIEESTLLDGEISINLMEEYLNNKGYQTFIIPEKSFRYLWIDWSTVIATLDNENNSILFSKIRKEHGLFNIPIVKEIERYAHENLLPTIVDSDARYEKSLYVKIPVKLKPLPCQQILSKVFKENDILFSGYNENNSNEIYLSWNEESYKSFKYPTFSKDNYILFKETALERLIELRAKSDDCSIHSAILKQMQEDENMRHFYFDEFDFDSFNLSISSEAYKESSDKADDKKKVIESNKDYKTEEDIRMDDISQKDKIKSRDMLCDIGFQSVISNINYSIDITLLLICIIIFFINVELAWSIFKFLLIKIAIFVSLKQLSRVITF